MVLEFLKLVHIFFFQNSPVSHQKSDGQSSLNNNGVAGTFETNTFFPKDYTPI